MKFSTIQLILFISLFAVIQAGFIKRIFGGRDAEPLEFPNIVSIYGYERKPSKTVMFATGVIYNDLWILVTGRCAWLIDNGTYPRDFVTLYAGKSKLLDNSPYEQKRRVEKEYIHRFFDNERIDNSVNLGLLKMNEKLVFNEYVKAASISLIDQYPSGSALIAGWGSADLIELSNRVSSNNLKVSTVKILSKENCKAVVRKIVESSGRYYLMAYNFDYYLFCTNTDEDMDGPVAGDHGGPVMQKNPITGLLDVIALIPDTETSVGLPGLRVYTLIAPFVPWIANKTLYE